MPTNNDFLDAVPLEGPVDKDLLRAALIARPPYVFADAEDPTDFIAVVDGARPLAVSYNWRWFFHDPNDTTTPPDGTTVLVTADNERYKIADLPMTFAVLARDVTTPPGDPDLGDSYVTSDAPDGDWAAHPVEIATWTARGWKFTPLRIGWLIHVATDDSYWHLNAATDFVPGMGVNAIGANQIRQTMLIGGCTRWIVERQNLNAPPVSAALGVAWIIGSSPSGDWNGHAGKIATSYDNAATWTIITPTEGVAAYDKQTNADYRYDGGWKSGAGAWIAVNDVFTVSGSEAIAGTNSAINASTDNYTYNPATPPTTATKRRTDGATLSHKAQRSGTRRLRFSYSAMAHLSVGEGNDGLSLVLMLLRDTETNAIDWSVAFSAQDLANTITPVVRVAAVFTVDVPDESTHTYTIAITRRGSATASSQLDCTALTRRSFQVEEKF